MRVHIYIYICIRIYVHTQIHSLVHSFSRIYTHLESFGTFSRKLSINCCELHCETMPLLFIIFFYCYYYSQFLTSISFFFSSRLSPTFPRYIVKRIRSFLYRQEKKQHFYFLSSTNFFLLLFFFSFLFYYYFSINVYISLFVRSFCRTRRREKFDRNPSLRILHIFCFVLFYSIFTFIDRIYLYTFQEYFKHFLISLIGRVF